MTNIIRSLVFIGLIISFSACSASRKKIVIGQTNIVDYKNFSWQDNNTKFPFSGNIDISTREYELPAGKYTLLLTADSRLAQNRPSYFRISFGPHFLRRIEILEKKSTQKINFELFETTKGKFTFSFVDDFSNECEDRNVYVYFPVIVKPY